MRVRGKIAPGVFRGEQLIDKYAPRLKGLLGFDPFRGTLNVKTERKIDLKFFATKTLEHIILDGSRHVDAYLAPVKLYTLNGHCSCWAIRPVSSVHEGYVHGADTVELIAKENLREKFSLKDDDVVELEFEGVAPKEIRESILGRLTRSETRLSR